MAFVSDFTVPKDLDPRLREKAFDVFLRELRSTASDRQKQESDTVPPPTDSHHAERMRIVVRKPDTQQKPEVSPCHEPPSSSSNTKLGLSLSTRTRYNKPTAQGADSRQAPKPKGSAADEKYTATSERNGEPSQVRALDNGSVRREATRRSAITKRRETEKGQSAMIEHLRNMIMEHEHTLRQLPSLREFEEMKKRLSSLEGKVFLRDMENDRLQTEKESLMDSLTEAKDDNLKLQVELDGFKQHFGVIPPKYRRRDDLRGKPFKHWRRDPTTAAHRPKPIDTDSAARSVHRVGIVLPVVDEAVCDSSDCASKTGDDDMVERSNWRHQREENDVPSVQRTEVSTNGPTSLIVQSTTSMKRAHDGQSSDTDLHSPPVKRLRERKRIDIVNLCNRSAEDDTNVHTPVRPCTPTRGESDCIDQVFL